MKLHRRSSRRRLLGDIGLVAGQPLCGVPSACQSYWHNPKHFCELTSSLFSLTLPIKKILIEIAQELQGA
jgi:hypothetical protein